MNDPFKFGDLVMVRIDGEKPRKAVVIDYVRDELWSGRYAVVFEGGRPFEEFGWAEDGTLFPFKDGDSR